MSKKIKLILASLSLVLFVALFSSFIPTTATYAYPGGLLDGKTGFKSDTLWSSTTTPITSITDNNNDTKESTVSNRWYWFDLESNKNISSYILLGGTVTIVFFDVDKKQIGSPIENQNGTGEPMNISYVGARYVALHAITTGGTLKEFDVFAQTQTPEPTVIPSPTPDPTPVPTPIPSGDRAILTIELSTGAEKEYDLPMSEVNAFLNWYDSANGSARYGIDKHHNNKGPFSKRTEYVIHDKILTFEVSEYTTTE